MSIPLTTISIDKIHRRSDARPLNNNVLDGLAESIEALGLINPVRVRRIGDGYEVIAGAHRFAACDLLGHREIAAIVVDDDDLHAELAMIDENLCRAELSPADRAKQTARRKAIYLSLHPETAQYVAGANASNAVQRNATEKFSVASFATDTAAKTGQTDRTVRLHAERGEKIVPEALDEIQGTPLDRGVYLDQLKRVAPDQQLQTAQQDLQQRRERPEQPRGGIVGRYAPEPTTDTDYVAMFERFRRGVDWMLAIPSHHLIVGAGRQRAVLGQLASSLAERLDEIIEGLDR